MHNTRVVMKDGQVFCGAIWEWRPTEGFFTIADYNEGRTDPTRIELRDVVSAVTSGQRVAIHSPPEGEDRDELARARRDGWTGMCLRERSLRR